MNSHLISPSFHLFLDPTRGVSRPPSGRKTPSSTGAQLQPSRQLGAATEELSALWEAFTKQSTEVHLRHPSSKDVFDIT